MGGDSVLVKVGRGNWGVLTSSDLDVNSAEGSVFFRECLGCNLELGDIRLEGCGCAPAEGGGVSAGGGWGVDEAPLCGAVGDAAGAFGDTPLGGARRELLEAKREREKQRA